MCRFHFKNNINLQRKGEGDLRASETMSPLRANLSKEMKNDKGREGGHKIRKMGQYRLWMAPT